MNDYKIIDHRDKPLDFIGDKGELRIGQDCHLNDAIIDITGGVEIGDRTHFGHQVMILTTDHPPEITDGAERAKTVRLGRVIIEDDAYVGSRAIVLRGAFIGKGSYIGAGSVVTPYMSIGRRQLWAGNPAKFIREL